MPRILCGALAAVFSLPLAAAELWVVNKGADTVDVIATTSGERLARLPTGHGPHEVAVSADGRLAVVTDYGTAQRPGASLQVYDARARKPLRTIDLGEHQRPHGVLFLPDHRRVAVTTEGSGHLLVVDAEDGRIAQAVATGQEISHMVALSPDGMRAYVTNMGSDSLTVIDLEAGEHIADVATGAQAEGVAVVRGGSEIWVSNRAEDSISIVDAGSLEVIATLDSPGFPIRVELMPDGRHALVTNARAAELAVFAIDAREEVARVDVAEGLEDFDDTLLGRGPLPIGVIADPGGERVYVALAGGDRVAVIDTAQWRVVAHWMAGREPDGLAVTPGEPEP